MELQGRVKELKSKGLGLAVISYDSPEILTAFGKQRGIAGANPRMAGIAFPGTFMLDRSTMNNGGRGTLQVTVPPGAAAGSFALIWLTSALTADDFRWWPIVVVAN